MNEIETARDDNYYNRMFKAAKAIYTNHRRVNFIHDENGKNVTVLSHKKYMK